jgi:hypothetical protein
MKFTVWQKAHVKPGNTAKRFGVNREEDRNFVFYLIQRSGAWKLALG